MRTSNIWMILAGTTIVGLSSWCGAVDFAFGPATNLGPNVNMGSAVNHEYSDGAPCISADGLSLYFSSDRWGGTGSSDLWVSRRASVEDPWGNPMNLGPVVNLTALDSWPNISADGLTLHFASNRGGNYDLWVTKRATTDEDWGQPANVGASVNLSSSELGPCISPDGLSLYFSSNRSGFGNHDLWVSTRTTPNGSWGTPYNLGGTLNSSSNDGGPSLSADGLTLYFQSDRYTPTASGYNIWMTIRSDTSSPWGTPVPLGTRVNTNNGENCPSISADGLSLYFTSDRIGMGDYDLYVVKRDSVNEDFQQATCLSSNDWGADISADDLFLFFCSDRPGGSGGFDLWVASRATPGDPWTPAMNLGPIVNTDDAELAPNISVDGLSLYFYSDRAGGRGGFDLWVTTRASLSDDWNIPANLGSTVNSVFDDVGPSISADGLSLYFSDNEQGRPGGKGLADLWVTKRETVESPWGAPVNLGSTVNSAGYERHPCISADGLRLYFCGRRTDTYGREDIWMASRVNTEEPFGRAVNLGPMVNNILNQSGPSISADGLTLYFSSEIPGGFGGWDIWQVRPAVPVVDLNGDGIVDLVDLVAMAEKWLWKADWR